MSNYSKENLIAIPKNQVNPGDLAVKIGDEIFICGKSMQFYKCASVDTASKTWTGYRAVLKDGGYAFETELTEGLFCDEGYTPAVGTVYSEDAMIAVRGLWQNIITEGLVFRASFSSSTTAETGQDMSDFPSGCSIGELGGKTCLVYDGSYTVSSGSHYYKGLVSDKKFAVGLGPFTVTSWVAKGETGYSDEVYFWWMGDNNPVIFSGRWFNGYTMIDHRGSYGHSSVRTQNNEWVFLAASRTGTDVSVYINGELVSTISCSENFPEEAFHIMPGGSTAKYMRDFRFYNRALTADEIVRVMREGDGTTVEPDSPSTDDPVFYAPLASDVSQAETGQALTTYGNVTFKSTEAVPCAVFSGNSSDYISFDDTGMPDGSSSRTISLLVKRTASITDATLFNYGSDGTGTRFGLFMHDSKIVCGIGGTNVDLSYNFQINTWYCLTVLLDKNAVTLYVNGENIGTNNLSTTPNTVLDSVGYLCHRNGNPFTGEIANLRVYDRLLTPAEIQLLANELTPTA